MLVLSQVNTHQKATTEKDFINQVDMMTHSVDTSQLLFPASPVIVQ
jgi:hypothetical protein